MSKKTEIKKIVIQIGEHELSLKPDEARELMNVLKELLEPAKDTTYIPYPVYPDYRPWRVGPYWAITMPSVGTGGQYVITSTSTSSDIK